MQIVEDKALLLKLKHPERVLNTIPKSKRLDDGQVLVRVITKQEAEEILS